MQVALCALLCRSAKRWANPSPDRKNRLSPRLAALRLVQGHAAIADYGVSGDTDETSKGLSIVGDVSLLC